MGEIILLQRPEQATQTSAHFSAVGNLALQAEPQPDLAPSEELAPTHEKYAHSLRTIRTLGGFIAKNTVETPEGMAAQNMLRADFETGLAEMLNTDRDFRELLDISPANDYKVIDGLAVMSNGVAVIDMIRQGAVDSAEAAKTDERLETQAARDAVDEKIASQVNELQTGELLVGISMDPKEAIERDGEAFWHDGFGYRKGLAFIQWYYKIDKNIVRAGAYSVGHSDKAAWSELLKIYGWSIPPETSSDAWLAHTQKTTMKDAEAAKAFITDMRRAYYQARGVAQERLSVTELLKTHYKALVERAFDDLYKPFAAASHSGVKNEAMHNLAGMYLHDSSHLGSEMRRKLMKIYNSEVFDDDDSRAMEFMIRYAVVTNMREGLGTLLRPQAAENTILPMHVPTNTFEFMQQLAFHANNGARQGLTFGGCAAGFKLGEKESMENGEGLLNPQDAFGGKANQNAGDEDEAKIPANIRCIKCRRYSRKEQVIHKGKTEDSGYWCCPKCKYAIDVCTGEEVDEHGNKLVA